MVSRLYREIDYIEYEVPAQRTSLFQLSFQSVQQKDERIAELVEDRAVSREIHPRFGFTNLNSVVHRTKMFRIQAAYTKLLRKYDVYSYCMLIQMYTCTLYSFLYLGMWCNSYSYTVKHCLNYLQLGNE